MRIVYLNPCGKLGGAETSLREILSSLRISEPDWDLRLVLGEDGSLAQIARGLGVQVIIQPFPGQLGQLGDGGSALSTGLQLAKAAGAVARYRRELAALLRELKPDLIHTNGFKMHLLGALCRPSQVPLLWHIHDYVSSRRLASRLLRLAAGSCNHAIANSKSVARDLGSALPELPVTTVYNAIDLRRFSPSGARLDLDALSGLAPAVPGTVRVGLVATFAHWKGHDVFLQAIARLANEVPVRGYIVGGPIYQTRGSQWSAEELRKRANELCGTGRLGFTGFVEDSAAVMRSLDVVVHASTQPEPFGMVIIEGMACGRAVIASRSGGAAELFSDGENALGHPAGDFEKLADQIQRLAGDPELRARLGHAGRSTAERHYDSKRLARELRDLYRQVVPEADHEPAGSAAVLTANRH